MMKTPYVVFNLIITHQTNVYNVYARAIVISGSMNSEMNELPLYNLKCIPISIEVTHSSHRKYTFVANIMATRLVSIFVLSNLLELTSIFLFSK